MDSTVRTAPPPQISRPKLTSPRIKFECKHALRPASWGNGWDWEESLRLARVEIRNTILKDQSWSRRGSFLVTIHIPVKPANPTTFNQFFLELIEGLLIKKLKEIRSFGNVRGDKTLKHPVCIIVNTK